MHNNRITTFIVVYVDDFENPDEVIEILISLGYEPHQFKSSSHVRYYMVDMHPDDITYLRLKGVQCTRVES